MPAFSFEITHFTLTLFLSRSMQLFSFSIMISSRVWPSFANENRHEEYIVYIIFEPIGASINTYAAKISKRKVAHSRKTV